MTPFKNTRSREYRPCWRICGLTVAGAAFLCLLLPVDATADTQEDELSEGVLVARSFVVKDDAGRERAVLGFHGNNSSQPERRNPSLRLMAPNGQVRFEFGFSDTEDAGVVHMLRDDGTHGLTLFSGKGGNRVTFQQRPGMQPPIVMETWRESRQDAEGGRIEFFNPRGVPQAGLAVWSNDGPGIRLYDPEGRPFEPNNPAAVPTPRDESSVTIPKPQVMKPADDIDQRQESLPVRRAEVYQLIDEKDRVRAVFGHMEEPDNHSVAVVFFDLNGEARTGLQHTQSDNRTELEFCDANGRKTLSARVSPAGSGFFLFTSNRDKSVGGTVTNTSENRVGTTVVCLSGSDGRPRVVFGEHRGHGTLGAWDQTGDKILLDIE